MPNLTTADRVLQYASKLRIIKFRVAEGVELVQIDVVGPQCPQRILQLPLDLRRAALIGAVHRSVKRMPELRRDDPLRATFLDRTTDQRFREMIPIALRGIDEINPQFPRADEHAIDFVGRKRLAPLSTELPRADSDDGHGEIRFSESTVFHVAEFTRMLTV